MSSFALEVLIGDISEDCYCAGWMADCEYAVWALLVGDDPGPPWYADAAQLDALRAESERLGGWLRWHDASPAGPQFVTTAQWLELYRQWRERRPQQEQAT